MPQCGNDPFRLRASLIGHEKDVRCLCTGIGLSENLQSCLISGSRDITVRVWSPNENDVAFTESLCAGGHSSFVASICVIPTNSPDFPNGGIISGSGDGTILVHSLDSPEPAKRIPEAHGDTVSSIFVGSNGYMVTGSWDKTAKVWMNFKSVMTLKGHEAAVWSVLADQSSGIIITGSADKTIGIWSAGECHTRLTGHTDCVRGLSFLPPTPDNSDKTLLSCSNDGSVRRWSLATATCLSVYSGHTDFIYSLALGTSYQGDVFFISSGEDRTVRVWNPSDTSGPVQTIALPAQSIWCVSVLPNGDICCGGSDGIIRVFTQMKDRFAPQEVISEFEKALSKTTVVAQTFGGIKFKDLPGPDVLLAPGRRDGQTVMVRYGEDESQGHVECHMWSAADDCWNLVGQVVGSTSSASNGQKTEFAGKMYDYVFDVEIDQQTLKLPYNNGENPWTAAHSFLERYELNPVFLDEVAAFIEKNTKSVTIGEDNGSKGNVDPFTGGSSYHTGSATNGSSNGSTNVPQYFPEKNHLLFDAAPNLSGIRGKMIEFDEAHSPNCVGSEILHNLVDSVASIKVTDGEISEKNIELLGELVYWPDNHLFPVLDMIRVLCTSDMAVSLLFKNPRLLPTFLKQLMPERPTANQFLTLRILNNCFACVPGRMIMLSNSNKIIQSLDNLIESNNKNVQIALATILLNYAVVGFNEKLAEVKIFQGVADTAKYLLERGIAQVDPEAVFRSLVALGTLIRMNQASITESVKQSLHIIKVLSKESEMRIKDCAKSLSLALSAA